MQNYSFDSVLLLQLCFVVKFCPACSVDRSTCLCNVTKFCLTSQTSKVVPHANLVARFVYDMFDSISFLLVYCDCYYYDTICYVSYMPCVITFATTVCVLSLFMSHEL